VSEIFIPKNYQNLKIGFQVTVENVGDTFFETSVYIWSLPSPWTKFIIHERC